MNKMTTKNSKGIFPQEWFKKKKTIIKPNVESQKTPNNHTNFDKKEQNWNCYIAWFHKAIVIKTVWYGC